MAFNYSFTVSDPYAALDPQDAIVSQALGDALAAWSQYINGVGTLQVRLNIAYLGGPDAAGDEVLADASATAYRYTGAFSNGEALTQNSAAYALTTGNHLASSDITINLNSAILSDLVNEQSDNLVSDLEHELAHGFGINGFRSATGQLMGTESAFDALSTITPGGQDYFTGPVASSVFGGAVPLTTAQGTGSNYYHVGVGNASDPASLSNDLMYWISGPNRSISGLDVAILEDIGIPVSAAGQVLIDPSPTSSMFELAGNGTTSVTDAAVGGVTQPDEVVTITTDGLTLGVVRASSTGFWSVDPVGLIDGSYVFAATIAGAGGNRVVATQTVVIDTADPLAVTYEQVLGAFPDAASLAAGRNLLESGVSLQAIRAYLATSSTAAGAISAIYAGTLGRAISNGELQTAEGDLANGGSLASLRDFAATSPEAGGALATTYQSVLGLSAPAADITLDETLLETGQTLLGIRTYLSGTGEAFTGLNTVYQAVLGQPIPVADINLDEVLLGQGQSLAGIRSYLSTTSEASTALDTVYENVFGQPVPQADISLDETLLAQGQTLAGIQSYLASTPQAAAAVDATYQTVLGRTPSASELASAAQSIAAGGSLQAVTAGLINGPELANDINTATQAALGRPANAVEIAADQAEFSAGLDYTTLQIQLSELSGGPPPQSTPMVPPATIFNSIAAEITPQTIAGPGPAYVYGLLNNDALIASRPESVLLTLTGRSGEAIVNGFNPLADILQVQTGQDANFSNLSFFANGPDTAIELGGGGSIYLQGVAETALHAGNFRFA